MSSELAESRMATASFEIAKRDKRIAELEAELAAVRADAERYRWLAANAVIETLAFRHDGKDPASTIQPLSNAIDAAMQETT